MNPDRLKFLKEMLSRRKDIMSELDFDWSEMYHEASQGITSEEYGDIDKRMVARAKRYRRDLIKDMFKAEDARAIPTLNQQLDQRLLGRLHDYMQRLLDRAKGIKSLVPKGKVGRVLSVLGLPGIMAGYAFDHAAAADELGAGEDEFLRQMKGDTGGLSDEEMIWNALLGHD